ADPLAVARASCACPCDTPPTPARSPGAPRANRAARPRASPRDGVAPPSCGSAGYFLSLPRQSQKLPRRPRTETVARRAIPRTTPERGLAQRPKPQLTLSQEVSAPERRNHRANRPNEKVGESPHATQIITSLTGLARRTPGTAATL